KEASDILTERSRKHIFEGETRAKQGDSVGWHLESSGDKEKGTYILEGTRSPTDEHGVYEGNVMIEGLKKKARSTFFPKDWTEKQVETAIGEAYRNKRLDEKSGRYRGEDAKGVEIEMMLNHKGDIDSAYPVYKGPKYEGPKK
ncbi:MAG TPA: EndoU domain-containing protein, partial [Pseudomonadota bacterium]|nr:EndoU domain-containing protein [Pseudomonadota bacterium]